MGGADLNLYFSIIFLKNQGHVHSNNYFLPELRRDIKIHWLFGYDLPARNGRLVLVILVQYGL